MREYTKTEYDDGSFTEEEIYFNMEGRHRVDGPAVQTRSRDGRVVLQWYLHGKPHREDGPALIVQAPNGSVVSEEYYVLGHLISSDRRSPPELSKSMHHRQVINLSHT